MRGDLIRLAAAAWLLATARTATAQPVTITLEPSRVGASLSRELMGVNMANWFDITRGGVREALANAGIRAVRWPGGSESDLFHWRTNHVCPDAFANLSSTFDRFMSEIARPLRLKVSITLNYGTNETCDGPGDVAEAIAWINHAGRMHDRIARWTIGNEVYGSWEADRHEKPHDAATYAEAVATSWYPRIKAAQPRARIGVVVEPGRHPDWDTIVLSRARYDFVELHFYAQNAGHENDAYLLNEAPSALADEIATLRRELADAHRPEAPILVGEIGSVNTHPGKQTMSITQALFAGMTFAELMSAGVTRAHWWLGFGGCNDASTGNFSDSLYGWQDFGGYMIFSDGMPEDGCRNAPKIALGVPFPTARALTMLRDVARDGEHMLDVTVAGPAATLRAYGMTHRRDRILLLFNLDGSNAAKVLAGIAGVPRGSGATMTTYGRLQYDRSRQGQWEGPVTTGFGPWTDRLPIELPPWSMSVLTIRE